ncbi:MAG: ATP-binding cassette domain-containing protein [Tissierellia bacterium]|nr:ATP-binding cassette domain-containing protein [Tissierellia bacterium]
MSRVLEVKNLQQNFALQKGILDKIRFQDGKIQFASEMVHAVNDLSFSIEKGEVFSLVGESGCGKSTTAKTILKIHEPKGGKIFYKDTDITDYSPKEMIPIRREMQMIFQDPYSSLNPRQTVHAMLIEPMLFHGITKNREEADRLVGDLLEKVGLRREQANRYPHQFSGGQRQRIGIARALCVNPELIIADEPVSALDVSIQAQILNLLLDLKDEYGLSLLVIAHNLSVVKHISDRLGIMYLGKIVEQGTKEQIFKNPLHPYTRVLFSAVPTINEEPIIEFDDLIGEIPSVIHLPTGCHFHARCKYAEDICKREYPNSFEVEEGHKVSCHVVENRFRKDKDHRVE